ncbi:MAG: NADH-quinone oxidoreductase subunit J [Paludibacter sp.]|nr:NADH-quinone oxidoreductase subunit J [Paludibacter sp.]MDD4198213.1 NADH-quinone oxidoreductase subunit J [Paludibacter sp.]MDD4427316.1 NADH-quinone oxidoreductase subunit J [Paludibacter sp.]
MIKEIIFYILALVITVFSIMAVNSRRLIRSATYLLFVLLATAGLYLLLDYHYLFAVQVAVYAGGIMVLFIFAILLTQKPGKNIRPEPLLQRVMAILLSSAGLIFCGIIIYQSVNRVYHYVEKVEIPVKEIGSTLMGTGKYEYILPFEAISIMLLACIVGAIMIARKR